MYSSRRAFVKSTAVLTTGAFILPGNFSLADKKKVIGLQLYSVRDDMKTDPSGTLKKLAAMGYKNVEHAGYSDRKFYGYSATEFRKLLDGLGLTMPIGHTSLAQSEWDASKNEFTDKWKKTLEDAVLAGQQYVISPSMEETVRDNYDELMHVLEMFNHSGELCKKYGLKFGYHNHDFEFKYSLQGKKIYDLIMTHTDATLVHQQIDVGNMYGVGGRATDIIKKYPGRFISMHVKDEIKSEKGEMGDGYESTILGAGVLGVKEIIDAGKNTGGTEYFIIEQESYQGKSPLDCAREDLEAMKKWGY